MAASKAQQAQILSEIEESIAIHQTLSLKSSTRTTEDVIGLCEDRDTLVTAESLQRAVQYGVDPTYVCLNGSSSSCGLSDVVLSNHVEEEHFEVQFERLLQLVDQHEVGESGAGDDFDDLSPREKLIALRLPTSTFEPLLESLRSSNRSALRQTLLQQQMLTGQVSKTANSAAAPGGVSGGSNNRRQSKKSRRKSSGDWTKSNTSGSVASSGSSPITSSSGEQSKSGSKPRRASKGSSTTTSDDVQDKSPLGPNQQETAIAALIGKAVAEGSITAYLISVALLASLDACQSVQGQAADLIAALFDKQTLVKNQKSGAKQSASSPGEQGTSYIPSPFEQFTAVTAIPSQAAHSGFSSPAALAVLRAEEEDEDEEDILARALILSEESNAQTTGPVADESSQEDVKTSADSTALAPKPTVRAEKFSTYGPFTSQELWDRVASEVNGKVSIHVALVALLTVLSASADESLDVDPVSRGIERGTDGTIPAGPLLAVLPVVPEAIAFLLIDYLIEVFTLELRDHAKVRPEDINEEADYNDKKISPVDNHYKKWNDRNDFLVWALGVLLRLLRAQCKGIISFKMTASSVGLGMVADASDLSTLFMTSKPFVLRLLQKVADAMGMDEIVAGQHESRTDSALRPPNLFSSSDDLLSRHFLKMVAIDAFVAGLGFFRPIAEERDALIRCLLTSAPTATETRLISQSLSPYKLRPVGENELRDVLLEKEPLGDEQPRFGYYELALLQKICFALANGELTLHSPGQVYVSPSSTGDAHVVSGRSGAPPLFRFEAQPLSVLESPESINFGSASKTSRHNNDPGDEPLALPINGNGSPTSALSIEVILMNRLGQDLILANCYTSEDISQALFAGELSLLLSIQKQHVSVFSSCMRDVETKSVDVKFNTRRCNSKIEISDEMKVATHKGQKQWASVSTSNGFSPGSGVYEWAVTITKCESGQVFVGLVTSEASLDTYIGGDRCGWGINGSKSLWFDKSKLSSFGIGFTTRQTVFLRYDSDNATLHISTPSRDDWILSFSNLPRNVVLFPAFSLYFSEDQISLRTSSIDSTSPSLSNSTKAADIVSKATALQAPTIIFAQILCDRTDAMLKRAEAAEIDPRHRQFILRHPFVSLLLPSFAASMLLVKLKQPATAYPSIQLLPYLTIVTKRLALLRDSSGNVNSPVENQGSHGLPDILGNMTGKWLMKSSAVGGINIPAQEYHLSISYNPPSREPPGDSKIAKLGVKVFGTGSGGLSAVNIQGTQNGTRIKFSETWSMGGGSVVEGRVSLCGSFFTGVFKDTKSGKGGTILGTRATTLSNPQDSSATAVVFKSALLCTMICGKLSSNLILGLQAIHSSSSQEGLVEGEEELEVAAVSGDQPEAEDVSASVVSSKSDQAQLREKWLMSDLFSGGLPLDQSLVDFLSDEIKFYLMIPAKETATKSSGETIEHVTTLLEDPLRSDAEMIDTLHSSQGWFSWWLKKIFPLLEREQRHTRASSAHAGVISKPLGPADASIPFMSGSALSKGSGQRIDDYVLQHTGHGALSKLGGEDMQRARKEVLAVLIKHSGTLSLCQAESEALAASRKTELDRPSPPLLDIWRATQQVIDQTIRQKQASGQTYSALRKMLCVKCELLHALQPNAVCLAVSDSLSLLTADASVDVWVGEAGKHIRQDCAKLVAEVVEFLLSPVLDINSLRQGLFKTSFVSLTRTAGFRSIGLLFNKLELTGSIPSIGKFPVLSSVMLQPAAAIYVVQALNDAAENEPEPPQQPPSPNAGSSSATSTKQPPSPVYGHYMDRLHGLNDELATELRTSFEQTYDLLTQMLSRSTWAGHRDGQCIALTCWGIRINPCDHVFLTRTGIFKVLQAVLDDARNSMTLLGGSLNSEQANQWKEERGPYSIEIALNTTKRLSQLALRIVHSLASQVAFSKDPSTLVSPTSAPRLQKMPSGPDTLSQSLFDMLYAELFNGIKSMLLNNSAAALTSSASNVSSEGDLRREDFLEGDHYMYRILRLLYIVSNSKVCQQSLSSPKWLSLLVAGVGSGELGVQRRILRLLRRMLVHLNPSKLVAYVPSLFNSHEEIVTADAPLEDEDFVGLMENNMGTTSAESLVALFFEGVSSLVPPNLTDSRLESNLLLRLHKSGTTKSLSAESLVALRVLQGVPAWRPVLDSAMFKALKALSIDNGPSEQWNNFQSVLNVVSALSVNGGYVDRLRLGGIVTIRPLSVSGVETYASRLAAASHSCGMLVGQSSSSSSVEIVVMDRGTRLVKPPSWSPSNEKVLQHTTSLAGSLPVRAMRINASDIMPSPDVPAIPEYVSTPIFDELLNVLKSFAIPWVRSRVEGKQKAKGATKPQRQSDADEEAGGGDDDDDDDEDDDEEDAQLSASESDKISDLEGLQVLASSSAFRAAAGAFQNSLLVNHLLSESPATLLDLLSIAEMETSCGGLNVIESIEERWTSLWDSYNDTALKPPSTGSTSGGSDGPPTNPMPSLSRDSSAGGGSDGGLVDPRLPLIEAVVAANVFSTFGQPRVVDQATQQAAVAQMVELGLPIEWCEVALRRCRYNVEMAINLCFESGDSMSQLVAEDAALQAQAARDRGSVGQQVRRTLARFGSDRGGPPHFASGGPRLTASSGGSMRGRSSQQEASSALSRQLQDMGFPASWCARAMEANNNEVDAALSWILSHSEELASQDFSPQSETSPVATPPAAQLNPLVCVSGTCEVRPDLCCLTSNSGGFPSVGCRGFGASQGKWYFELTMHTAGCVQIGLVDSAYEGSADQGRGVGDDEHSWAFDGWRMYLWHEFSADWGARWNVGDVVGCAFDMDNAVISFYLNGLGEEIGMGVAFTGFECSGGLYPTVSFNRHEKVQFNFGGTPFAHSAPPGYKPYIEHVKNVSQSNFLYKREFNLFADATLPQDDSKVDYFEDAFEEEKGDGDTSWQRRYFQEEQRSGGGSERLPRPPTATLPPSPPLGNRDLILQQFQDISKDLCILYSRMAVLQILLSAPKVAAGAIESGMILPLMQPKEESGISFEETEKRSSLRYLDALFLVLRICAVPSNRTKIYLMTMSTLPSTLSLPHNLGSILCTGGLPLLEELRVSFAVLLASCKGSSYSIFVKKVIDEIALDTFKATERNLEGEWVSEGGYLPVIYTETNSLDSTASIPSLGMAVWMTSILMEQFAADLTPGSSVLSARIADISDWLERLVSLWYLTLRASNISVKMCGVRTLSIILQDLLTPSGRLANVPTDVTGKILSRINLERLETYVMVRLEKERAALPVCSEYLQALLELTCTVKYLRESQGETDLGNLRPTDSGVEPSLFADFEESDYDWEAVSGHTMSESMWATWSGTVTQHQVQNLPPAERRPSSQERHDSPPELLNGCRVSRPAPLPPTPPQEESEEGKQDERGVNESEEGESQATTDSAETAALAASNPLPPPLVSTPASPSEVVEQFGTCIGVSAWEDDVAGSARIIKWDDGSTETVRWNTSGGHFDVTHVRMEKGKVVKRYPQPTSRLAKVTSSFGAQTNFGVLLRVRTIPKRQGDEEDVVSRLLGILEWPDFSASILVNGFAWEDNRWTLTEVKLILGTAHSNWSARFGSQSWRPGTTYELIQSQSTGDCTDSHSTVMCGNLAYDVAIGNRTFKVSGDINLQRSRLFTFDTKMRAQALQISSDKLCVTKAGGSAGCVFGSVGFSSGVHYWEIKIENSDVGSIFIGASEKPGSPGLPDVGRCNRKMGQGLINNRTSYRAPSNSHPSERHVTYGDQFLPGDTVGVLLDLNRGRLSFFLDGFKYGVHNISDLGEAFDNLTSATRVKPRTFFPVVYLHKTNDRALITSRWLSCIGTMARDELDTHYRAWGLLSSWSIERKTSGIPSPMNMWIYRDGWREWIRWKRGRFLRVRTRCKTVPIVLDRSPLSCVEASLRIGLPFALFRGDRIVFSKSTGRQLETKEEAVILGAYDGRLWYRHEVSGNESASASPASSLSQGLVESAALAWALAPADVVDFTLLRRGNGIDGIFIPEPVLEIPLPLLPIFYGGLITVVNRDGADMRNGLEIDTADLLINIPMSTTLLAIERRVNSSNITRYRVIFGGHHGWVSERKRLMGGDDEDLLVSPKSASSLEDPEGEMKKYKENLQEAATACNLPEEVVRSNSPTFSAAMQSWRTRVGELGFAAETEPGRMLSESFSITGPSDPASETMAKYLELATTLDGGERQWFVEADMQLSELVSRCALRDGVSPQNLSFSSMEAAVRSIDVVSSPLVGVDVDRIMARAALLRVANQVFAYSLPQMSINLHEEKLRKQCIGSVDEVDVITSDLRKAPFPDFAALPTCGPPLARTNSIHPPISQRSPTIYPEPRVPASPGAFAHGSSSSSLLSSAPGAVWNPPSTARRLRSLRRLLFTQTKTSFWESVLDSTTTATALPQEELDEPREIKTIKINRVKATLSRLASIPHPIDRLRVSVFGQLHKEIRTWSNTSFRRSYLGKGHGGQKRAFKVKFVAEGVDDYGGPYRAVFEQIVDEMQSDTLLVARKPSERCLLPLLIPCSNRHAQIGSNQDKFLLSTAPSSPLTQELMQFFGKLVGTAVRQNLNLGLDFSALFWRSLVRLPLTRAHLETVDISVSRIIEEIITVGMEHEDRHLLELSGLEVAEAEAATKKFLQFVPEEWIDYFFSTYLPDGTKVELVPGGEDQQVCMGNWREFILLLERCRLQESVVMFKAFRDGLSAVLPLELSSLFTPNELEQLVCGSSKVDIALLRQCTEYEDILPDSPTACNFWRVLEDMSNEERTLFLRFVWARSRMPASAQDLPMNFKLQGATGKAKETPDAYLPHAQTCFFSFTLPSYSSLEIMREKLLYAISNSPNMDADVRLTSGEGWGDG